MLLVHERVEMGRCVLFYLGESFFCFFGVENVRENGLNPEAALASQGGTQSVIHRVG